jgi:hypothetical protein
MDGSGVTTVGGTVNRARLVGAWEKYVIFPGLY